MKGKNKEDAVWESRSGGRVVGPVIGSREMSAIGTTNIGRSREGTTARSAEGLAVSRKRAALGLL
jgi:hypothetical protein